MKNVMNTLNIKLLSLYNTLVPKKISKFTKTTPHDIHSTEQALPNLHTHKTGTA